MNGIQAPGSSVNVSIQAILEQLHKRYGAQISALMQEVSELQCAVDAQAIELDEVRAKFQAVTSSQFPPAAPDGVYDDLLPRPTHPSIDLAARGKGRPVADNPQA